MIDETEEEAQSNDSDINLPQLRQRGRNSVIEQAKKQIEDWPRLEQYKGGRPWAKSSKVGNAAPIGATAEALLKSIKSQASVKGGEGEGAVGVTKRQVARLVLDTSRLAEASIRMRQACTRAVRLVTDVEKLHSVENAVRQAAERYDAVKGEGSRVVIVRDNAEEEDIRHTRDPTPPKAEPAPPTPPDDDDDEDDEYETEPPEVYYEDVTSMPPGRVSHRAMDMLTGLAPSLNLITDTAKALQTEMGITNKKPRTIRPTVRSRDCRTLTMKIIWLQKKVAAAMDTIRSYLVLSTKGMNDQARSALKEIKSLRQQVANLESALRAKEQQVEELEFTLPARGESPAPPSPSQVPQQHPVTALLEANKPLLGRMHRKLLMAADDYILEEKETLRKPEKTKGKAGKAAASRQAELEMVRRYCELLDKVQVVDAVKRKPAKDLEALINEVSITVNGVLPSTPEPLEAATQYCSDIRAAMGLGHKIVTSFREVLHTVYHGKKSSLEPFMAAVAGVDHAKEVNLQGYQHVVGAVHIERVMKDAKTRLKLVKDQHLQRLITQNKTVPEAVHVVLNACLAVLDGTPCGTVGELAWIDTKTALLEELPRFVDGMMQYVPDVGRNSSPVSRDVVEYLQGIVMPSMPLTIAPLCGWLLSVNACYDHPMKSWLVDWPPHKPTTLQDVAHTSIPHPQAAEASVASIITSISGHLAACLLMISDDAMRNKGATATATTPTIPPGVNTAKNFRSFKSSS